MLNEDELSSFENIKRELSSISTLAHPVPEAPLSLTVDTSDSAVGSVLQQVVKGITQPVAAMGRIIPLLFFFKDGFGIK